MAGLLSLLGLGESSPPKSKKKSATDDITQLSERGAALPMIFGRRRIGPLFGWAGNRIITKERAPSGGKKGGGSGAPKVKVFREEGWHILCLGPAYQLDRILEGGETVWIGPINSGSHPSGSTIDAGRAGSFKIYWGTADQDANTFLGDSSRVGVTSRWPFICYVEWTSKRLGQIAQWPQLDYEIFCLPTESQLTHSGPFLRNGGYEGANPAHILEQLFFLPYPHGMGFDRKLFNIGSLESMGDTCRIENLLANIKIEEGDSLETVVEDILIDIGHVLSFRDGLWNFVPIRKSVTTPATIPLEILEKRPEVKTHLGDRQTTAIFFEYEDYSRKYRKSVLQIPDDGKAIAFTGRVRGRKERIFIATDFSTAQIISERRSQENLGSGSILRLKALRGARSLYPGQPVIVEDIPLVMRVSSKKLDPESNAVQLNLVTDYFGVTASTFQNEEGGGLETPPTEPDEDLAISIVEIPSMISFGSQNIMVPRIRASAQVGSADIWLSVDDSTYTRITSESDLHTGGTLDAALPSTGPKFLETGPVITLLGPDIGVVPEDLSGNDTSWRNGRQLCIIGNEICFLQKVTALGGSSYRLDGLIRARYDTDRGSHAMGAPVLIFLNDEIEVWTDLLLAVGETIYVKTQPATGVSIPLSDVTTTGKATKTLVGKGLVPMNLTSLYTANKSQAYLTGQDITFKWGYRSPLVPGTGAGQQGAGNATGHANPQGEFRLEFLTSLDVLVQTITGLTTNTYTLTNSNLSSWFGSEPSSFKVQVTNVNAGYSSNTLEVTVVKES